MSDEQRIHLERRFRDGDKRAYTKLVRPHLETLYTLCLRMMGNPTEAEEITQEVLVRAFARRSRYQPGRSFRAWVLAIANNRCHDRLRTVWWRRVHGIETMSDLEISCHDTMPPLEKATAQEQRVQMVRQLVSMLPLKYREAVALFHLQEMTYAEMAEITGASVPALKQRVRRGNIMLRERLERLYPELAPVGAVMLGDEDANEDD